ncbi:unnamed protein product, partial [marine sediment metagenome]
AIYCPALAAAAGDNLFIKNISADSDFGSGDITTIGTFNAGAINAGIITLATLSLESGLITDFTGTISFGDEHLLTTGTFAATEITATNVVTGSSFITGGDIGVAADTDLLQLAANALTVNGTITSTGTPFITGGDIGIAADTDLLQLTDGALRVNGTIRAGEITGTSLIAGELEGDIGTGFDTDLLHLEAGTLTINGALIFVRSVPPAFQPIISFAAGSGKVMSPVFE